MDSCCVPSLHSRTTVVNEKVTRVWFHYIALSVTNECRRTDTLLHTALLAPPVTPTRAAMATHASHDKQPPAYDLFGNFGSPTFSPLNVTFSTRSMAPSTF